MGPKSENVKISSAWIRPKWADKQQTHIFPTYFACPKEALARQESEPKRQRNDRSENMSSKEALSDPCRSPKSKIFNEKWIVSIFRIVVPVKAWSTISEK